MSEEITEGVETPEIQEEITEEQPIAEEGQETAEAVSEMSGEDQAELQDAVEEAIEDGATEEEVKELIKEFTLKVNGKEIKTKIDLNDEEAVKKELQMAYAGRGAMQRARELEKTFEEALTDLRNDPLAVLREMGMDVDQLTKNHLESQIEQMKKSPEELAREQYERDLQEAREAERRASEELERIRYEQTLAEEGAKLEEEIAGALDAYTTLPDNPIVRQKVAETMAWAMENGYEDVTANDVLPTVEAELKKQQQEFFNSMPIDFFENFIGKQNMEKMRENRIAKAKAAPKKASVTETTKEKLEKEEKKKKLKAKDYFRNLGQ